MKKRDKERILAHILNNPELLTQIDTALKIDRNVKITGLIFESKNYETINKLKGNRKIDKNNLKKIVKSIEKNGYKKSQPVTINKEQRIIDGQHRKVSCEQLDIAVPFVIETEYEDSLKLTQDLNSNQKNWKLSDYIESYVDRNFEDYIRFNKFMQEEGISESILIWFLYHSRNGHVQDKIKNGELICTDLQLAQIRETLKDIREVREAIPNKSPQYKNFMKDKVLMPLITIMGDRNYSQSRMIAKISEEFFNLRTDSMINAGNSFVAIYNKKLAVKNRIADYR